MGRRHQSQTNQTPQKKILEQTQPITARSRNNLTDYIRSKNDSWSKSDGIYPHKDYFVFHDVSIFVQEPLPSEVDLNMVLHTVENVLPQKFIETVCMYAMLFEIISKTFLEQRVN